MVSAPQTDLKPNLTLDVAVLSKAYVGEVSLSQLARDLGADVSNVRKAKNWLINNRHPTFDGYETDAPLNPEQAEAITASIDASELGKDYPEGKVIQPQRSARWSEMKEYQDLYPKFAELKPDWKAPQPSNPDAKKERKSRKKKEK